MSKLNSNKYYVGNPRKYQSPINCGKAPETERRVAGIAKLRAC